VGKWLSPLKVGRRFVWVCLASLVFPGSDLYADSVESRPVEGSAESTPLRIGFDWERRPGAESCPDSDALLRAIDKVLDRRPFVRRERAHVFIRGSVAPTSDLRAYQVRLMLVAGDGSIIGERKLRSDSLDCATLIDPLTLVIGLAVDTLRAMPRASLRIPKPEVKAEPWKLAVMPDAVAVLGLLPSLGVGIGVDAMVEPPSFWPVDASVVSWFVPNRDRIDGAIGGDFRALAASLSVCPVVVAGGTAQLQVCLGAAAARINADGIGLDLPQSQTSWIWGAQARTILLLPLGQRVAVEPSFGAVVPFVRDRFTYRDALQQVHIVHRPSQILFTLELAVPIRIF
jgi:hypothetical protein